MENKESTRHFSDMQEERVSKTIGGSKTPSSGSGHFIKGDVIQREAHLLVECKTVMTEKQSISIKKEWIEKNIQEARAMRLDNSCLAVNFGPNQENYYVIDEKLMRFLVEKLKDDYEQYS